MVPFFAFPGSYGFYSYRMTDDKENFPLRYKFYVSVSLLLLMTCEVFFLLLNVFGWLSWLHMQTVWLCFIGIRMLYLLYISYFSVYYRIIDKPSVILLQSICCSIVSFILVIISHFLQWNVVLCFLLPQLILTSRLFHSFRNVLSPTKQFKECIQYLKKGFFYTLPIIIHTSVVAFVMNIGKVYAFNRMTENDMYAFSFVMRIAMVVSMMSASFMAYYGKNIYLNGYTKRFARMYLLSMFCATLVAFSLLIIYNLFTDRVILIDTSVLLIVCYTFLHSISSVFEPFFGRRNKNYIVMIASLMACGLYAGMFFISPPHTLFGIAVSMLVYIIAYLSIISIYICIRRRKSYVC